MSKRELTAKVLALSLDDRVELAEALWQSIAEGAVSDPTAEEREALGLAKSRDQELADGEVAGRTHHEVMEAARRALKCD
jgi:putative addiction module component (TIGR02574 family)